MKMLIKKAIYSQLLLSLPISCFANINNLFDETQWSTSGSVTLASDYRWRGISMSNNEPALQGSLMANNKNGTYLGVWASSTDINNGASIEADFMAGYRKAISKDTGITFQYMSINYPGKTSDFETNFSQFSVILDSKSILKTNDAITTSIIYVPNFYADSGKMWRYDGRYDFPLTDSLGLMAAVGVEKLENKQAFYKVWGNNKKDHYYDWKAGITLNIFHLKTELFYADNSTVNSNVSSMKPRFVVSVSKFF